MKTNTKKLFVVILALILAMPFLVEARQTLITSSNEFRIDFVRYDPTPLTPGKSGELWFEITNIQEHAIQNLDITVVGGYPFTTKESVVHLRELKPSETQTFSFKIDVNPNAPTGTYPISLQFYSPTMGAVNSETLSIVVKKPTALIEPVSIKTTPDIANPGGNVKVDVTLRNPYNSLIKDLAVKLDLSSTNYFVPLTTSNELNLPAFNPGDQEELSFDLSVSPNTPADIYKLPLIFTYTDESGNTANKTTYVGITVNKRPVYNIYLEDSKAFEKDKSGKIVLSVSNIGPVDIKYLSLKLLPSEDYQVVSKSQVYIGNLKPDDYQTGEFTIFRKNNGPLNVKVDYKDIYNNEYSNNETINVPFFTQAEAEKYGLSPQTTSPVQTILLTIFVLFGIWVVIGWIKHKSLRGGIKHVFAHTLLGIYDFVTFFSPKNLKAKYKEFKDYIKKRDSNK